MQQTLQMLGIIFAHVTEYANDTTFLIMCVYRRTLVGPKEGFSYSKPERHSLPTSHRPGLPRWRHLLCIVWWFPSGQWNPVLQYTLGQICRQRRWDLISQDLLKFTDKYVFYFQTVQSWNQDKCTVYIHLALSFCAGDAFRGYDQEQNQDTAPFSASDVDNDGCNPFCSIGNRTVESCSAQHNQTGWWFNQCGLANLNGCSADAEQSWGQRTHILWDTWTQNRVPHSIRSVTMKIRRIATNNWQRRGEAEEERKKHIMYKLHCIIVRLKVLIK